MKIISNNALTQQFTNVNLRDFRSNTTGKLFLNMNIQCEQKRAMMKTTPQSSANLTEPILMNTATTHSYAS